MSHVRDATISGFNEYVSDLKKDKKANYKFSLTLFDTEVEQPYVSVDIKKVKDLSDKTYQPRGNTALYDAVCKTVKEAKAGDKAIVVILTDGQENASQEYKLTDMRAIIKKMEKTGKWKFVYLGANQDSYAVGGHFGIAKGNIANFNHSHVGTVAVMSAMSVGTRSFADSSNTSQDFLTEKQKKDILKAK